MSYDGPESANSKNAGLQKVRELDTAQSRIHDTLQRINLTVDRSSAVDGIK